MKANPNLLNHTSLMTGLIFMFFLGGCKNEEAEHKPILSTTEVTRITQETAYSGGVITSDAGFNITSRGVCWNTTGNPTIEDNKKEDDGIYAFIFTSKLTGLTAGTTYYLRSYATYSKGTIYGSTEIFETLGSMFTDSRDGNVYKIITIGSQLWMAENLKYLPSVAGPGIGSDSIPYYYVYGYNGTSVTDAIATNNYTTYGVLYNWTAAKNACPTGWRLPTEWYSLESHLAFNGHDYNGTSGRGSNKVAKSLASASGWTSSSNTGAVGNTDYPSYRNKSGFTALPGGLRNRNGASFSSIGDNGQWWSVRDYALVPNWPLGILYSDNTIYNAYGIDRENGLSIRCVRD